MTIPNIFFFFERLSRWYLCLGMCAHSSAILQLATPIICCISTMLIIFDFKFYRFLIDIINRSNSFLHSIKTWYSEAYKRPFRTLLLWDEYVCTVCCYIKCNKSKKKRKKRRMQKITAMNKRIPVLAFSCSQSAITRFYALLSHRKIASQLFGGGGGGGDICVRIY